MITSLKFNQVVYLPLSVWMYSSNLIVVARYDNRKFIDKSIHCVGDYTKMKIGEAKKCLDTSAGDKLFVTVVHRESLSGWIDNWNQLEFKIYWRPLGIKSTVKIYKNGKGIRYWKGFLGRNDRNGPYMKYGIYSNRDSQNFKVMMASAFSDIAN